MLVALRRRRLPQTRRAGAAPCRPAACPNQNPRSICGRPPRRRASGPNLLCLCHTQRACRPTAGGPSRATGVRKRWKPGRDTPRAQTPAPIRHGEGRSGHAPEGDCGLDEFRATLSDRRLARGRNGGPRPQHDGGAEEGEKRGLAHHWQRRGTELRQCEVLLLKGRPLGFALFSEPHQTTTWIVPRTATRDGSDPGWRPPAARWVVAVQPATEHGARIVGDWKGRGPPDSWELD